MEQLRMSIRAIPFQSMSLELLLKEMCRHTNWSDYECFAFSQWALASAVHGLQWPPSRTLLIIWLVSTFVHSILIYGAFLYHNKHWCYGHSKSAYSLLGHFMHWVFIIDFSQFCNCIAVNLAKSFLRVIRLMKWADSVFELYCSAAPASPRLLLRDPEWRKWNF